MLYHLTKRLFSRLAGANLVTKSTVGVGIIGILSALSYGIYALTSSSEAIINNIERYLKEEKFTLTGQNETAQWNKAFSTYELEKDGFEIGEISSGEDIKKWCNNTLKQEIKSKDDENFKKAKMWCVHYKTIKEYSGKKKVFVKVEELNGKLGEFPLEIQTEINKFSVEAKKNADGIKIRKWCLKNAKRRFTNRRNNYYKSIDTYCLKASSTIS
ncbi:hypothetical protein A6V39_03925 [Candidatus Mycoplasma haematobovis]|uniref:Uncharacterized protein n=1 Tax=Candidatus Mycoplasma haematobovis TaxID=432608 RepID=A0A1A9QDK4_9MOLU|nr:hypothetical protein [Candidatus Mycoplasma haematobovis]OAL10036.1 hypothetical protein A6V39_03925 [Candidatus Mycoplasma haematobovis]